MDKRVDKDPPRLKTQEVDALVARVPGLHGTGEMLDRLALGFIAVDREYRIIVVNQVGCRMLGVAREALIGRSAMPFFSADTDAFEAQRALRAQGRADPYCALTRRADGTLHRVRVVPQLLRSREGSVVGSSGTFTPVDAQGRVRDFNSERREAYLRALEAAVPAGER